MKAIVYHSYGGPEVLTYTTLDKPAPMSKEVLVRIVSTSVTHGDIRMRKADPVLARFHSGLLKPNKYPILGFECSGVIDAIGTEVTSFKIGDEVMAFAGLGFGAYSEYMTVQTEGKFTKGTLVKKPANISFDEAAVSPTGGITAIGFLRDLGIEGARGKSILIIGASGSVGTYAVQVAKYYGAIVTGVTSTKNVELVKSLGADHVVDYKKDDFSRSHVKYDMAFDAVGLYAKSVCKKILKSNGTYASVKGSAKKTEKALELLAGFLESGTVQPVIDKTYQWDEIVEAHTYVDQGHKVGNVVVRVSNA
jgi:NADPH:quinone reductase-like Zn-dependent oxidoreductase